MMSSTNDEVADAFRQYEADWIAKWDGVEPFPDRLAIFRAGWEAGARAEMRRQLASDSFKGWDTTEPQTAVNDFPDLTYVEFVREVPGLIWSNPDGTPQPQEPPAPIGTRGTVVSSHPEHDRYTVDLGDRIIDCQSADIRRMCSNE